MTERIVRMRGARILWDRGGRNVGRYKRYIYVEWEDPRDPYNRLLIDITHYVDDFVEIAELLAQLASLTETTAAEETTAVGSDLEVELE